MTTNLYRATLGVLGTLAVTAGFVLYPLVAHGLVALPQGAGHKKAVAPSGKAFIVGVLDGIHAVDLKDGKVLKRIFTGRLPHNMLASADGKHVYVTNVGSQSVSEIDTEKLAVSREFLVGEIPDVPAHRKVPPAKLKAATSCFSCHFDPIGSLPSALAWGPEEKSLLVSEFKERSITWIDPVAGKTVRRIHFDLPTPSSPVNVITHPRTHEIWVLHRFEKEQYGKNAVVRATGEIQDMGAFDHDPPAGQKTSWITIHDPELKTEVARIQMELAVPFGAVWSHDGRWLYVAYRSSNIVAVFDAEKHQHVRDIEVGVSPTGLALSADGSQLYVTCLFSSPPVVQVVDLNKNEVAASLGIPPSPSLVKADPKTGLIYVTATGYNALLEIDPNPEAPDLKRKFFAGHQPLDVVLTP